MKARSKKPAGYRSIRGIRQGGGGPCKAIPACCITGTLEDVERVLLSQKDGAGYHHRTIHVHPVAFTLASIFARYGVREPMQ